MLKVKYLFRLLHSENMITIGMVDYEKSVKLNLMN